MHDNFKAVCLPSVVPRSSKLLPSRGKGVGPLILYEA